MHHTERHAHACVKKHFMCEDVQAVVLSNPKWQAWSQHALPVGELLKIGVAMQAWQEGCREAACMGGEGRCMVSAGLPQSGSSVTASSGGCQGRGQHAPR